MTIQKRLVRTLILCAIGLCLGALIALVTVSIERESSPTVIANASGVGGPFSLIDQDGVARTEADYKDSYKLIYFGFTYCPAICPTELQKMSEALADLPEATQKKIQPIFITIDPERDTVAVMKNYVPLFSKRLVGLTGSVEQVEAAKKNYKVYGAKVPQDDTYTMDHSSFIYFMTPDDKMIAVFKTSDKAADIAAKIESFL